MNYFDDRVFVVGDEVCVNKGINMVFFLWWWLIVVLERSVVISVFFKWKLMDVIFRLFDGSWGGGRSSFVW